MTRKSTTKRNVLLIALLSFCFINLFGQNKAITLKTVNLRTEASQHSIKINTIPKGKSLEVAECNDGWCEVEYKGTKGFVNKAFIKQLDNNQDEAVEENVEVEQINAVKYYKNVDGDRIKSPQKANKAPEGATAICRDGTYSFSQHRRGTCSHHGGVSRWL